MAQGGSSNERGVLGRLMDRLLGRDRGDVGGTTALFTAHQPPPSGRRPAPVDEPAPDSAPSGTATVPAPEMSPSEPDLFDHRPERQPADAPDEESLPTEESLNTSVHTDALEQISPRARQAPGVRVHDDHLDQRSGPVHLTPSQAIELARGGRDTLRPRDRD